MKEKKHEHKRWVACDVEQEYFGDDRKVSKNERKRKEAKDRSKYKKTDIKQKAETEKNPNWQQGRVISIVPEGILVAHGDARTVCSLRGLLKKEKGQFKNLVTVGDNVYFEKKSEGEGLIMTVEPRRTLLSRADNLSRNKQQLIAANIDQVLITASVVSPGLKPPLVDRYIIATEKGQMQPIVVVNKIDLLQSQDPLVAAERELYEAFLSAYTQAGIPVIAVSAQTGEGMDALKTAMQGKSSVFSGQSGVGKSSLINAVTDYQLEVGDVVERTQKGSHTTTTTRLLQLSYGGWCIDTPGIRSFGVWELSSEELASYFSEIFSTGHNCRYPNCTHSHENGCAVQEAVEAGKISPIRYMSYRALMESISSEHFRR